jgi:uncharacterized repeat protein (TIGR01451 family)
VRRLFSAIVLFGAFASVSAVASARPIVSLKLSAAVVHHDADGTIKLTPANGVTLSSGDVVRYEIVAANIGDHPADGVRPVDDVPAGTAFVAGSATGNGKAEYSLDHGKTWSAAPTVVVHDKDGDHTVKADPATYTAVRWTTPSALKPGASEHFGFDVEVK